MSSGSFKNVTNKLSVDIYIYVYIYINIILHLITYKGWYAIKHNQLANHAHF